MDEWDLSYHPVIRDSARLLADSQPGRLLVVGEDLPSGFHVAAEVRMVQRGDVALPSGMYSFVTEHGDAVMAVMHGAAPAEMLNASWEAEDRHPLIQAYGWFAEWWTDADVVPKPSFEVGSSVLTRGGGQEASVRSRDFDSGAWWYEIRLDGSTRMVRESSLLSPEIDDDPFQWIARPPADANRFAATLTRAKLREHLTDTVYSFRATRTIFRPYQFRPIIRLLSAGRLRLLIADEVGLGKTIEAGLVWTELDARDHAGRVLVVCPSMLVPKWRAEMRERFGYELDELDRPGLDELLEQVEEDRLPRRRHWICSLERLRVWKGLDRLSELSPQLDLVIADEAHAFRNSGTRSNALGALLSDWTDALVFLSATPLNLGNQDLYNLLELLAPGEFDDRWVLEERLEPNAVLNRVSASLFDREVSNETRRTWLHSIRDLTFGTAVTGRPEYAEADRLLAQDHLDHAGVAEVKRLLSQLHALSAVVTRTRKVEVQEHKAVREAIPIAVEWTDSEAALYQAIDRWQRDRARRLGLPVGFVTQMPLRLASTCLPAARDNVLALDGRAWAGDDMDPDDETDGIDPEDVPPQEVVDAARLLGAVDTKFDALVGRLEPVVASGRRVIVFTFSRKALAYLAGRLRARGISLAVMHGDVDRDERHRIMAQFRQDEFKVLLASRVASEGLDFEFASAIVNYDLPWNPMEVEQRIGRIDRFGQTEDKLLILNFHTPGTIETDIVERVHQRIGVFEDSIGELEPILQSALADLRRTMFDFELSPAQRERRLDEMLTALEEQRLARDEVESASTFLSSTDQAEIDGLEEDLLSSGRYIGQSELVLLLRDWVGQTPGALFEVDPTKRWAHLRGNEYLETQLRGVQAAGERSSHELDYLARQLRNEADIRLCLDQELARTSGSDLLGATHPLVRAALRVPGPSQARFACVAYDSGTVPTGSYLVTLALANWTGVRSKSEFWTAGVSKEGLEAPSEVGAGLLAALAEGELEPGPVPDGWDLEPLMRSLVRHLRRRQVAEETRRVAENEALVETRRISLRETHARKVRQIQQRISTLRARDKTGVIHLQESQLANQSRLLAEAEARLESTRHGELTVEHVAVCVVEVRGR